MQVKIAKSFPSPVGP